ncbi:MAG: LicD family protein [Chloroflexi bacterium]|nr:LicD family protein [Chloroflexota bacterium]MDA1147135.1 LicD family protein [Chloroflexota bacterium]
MSDAETAALMNRLEREIPPMDIANAEQFMREVKAVFDAHKVTFFLRQGTCLGAVRDGALIPWDDDLDLGSIIGLHGFTEDVIAPVAEALRATGAYVEAAEEGLYTSVKIFKYRIRIDWQCYRVVKGTIAHYPGVPFPVSLFEQLTPVDFIGDQYLVPSPPDEYLTFKYGPDWRTPKQVGYEKDVLDAMPSGTVPGRPGRLKQWFILRFAPRQTARLLVLDTNGDPVAGAEVRIAGLSRSRTDRDGVARFYLPVAENYALSITANGVQEVLYEEALEPSKTYVYQPNPAKPEGRYFVLTEG